MLIGSKKLAHSKMTYPNDSGSIQMNPNPNSASPHLTLFYDGGCPLCKAEMIFLSARNKAGKLEFKDVRQPHALDALAGVSCETALANIHAVTQEGTTLIGVEAFQLAYATVDLKLLSWFLGIKALQPMLRYGYTLFAKNRFTLSKVFGALALKVVKLITKKDRI